jgi:hypothetical protein
MRQKAVKRACRGNARQGHSNRDAPGNATPRAPARRFRHFA